jgi:hypothetical protein
MHGVNAESVMAHAAAPGPGLSVPMDDCTDQSESDESAARTGSADAEAEHHHDDDHGSSHPAQECAAGQPQQSGLGPAAPIPATTQCERVSLAAPLPGTVSAGAESVEPAARASMATTVLRI